MLGTALYWVSAIPPKVGLPHSDEPLRRVYDMSKVLEGAILCGTFVPRTQKQKTRPAMASKVLYSDHEQHRRLHGRWQAACDLLRLAFASALLPTLNASAG